MADHGVGIGRHQLHRLIEISTRDARRLGEQWKAGEAKERQHGQRADGDENDQRDSRRPGDQRIRATCALEPEPHHRRALRHCIVARRVLKSVDEQNQRDEDGHGNRGRERDHRHRTGLHVRRAAHDANAERESHGKLTEATIRQTKRCSGIHEPDRQSAQTEQEYGRPAGEREVGADGGAQHREPDHGHEQFCSRRQSALEHARSAGESEDRRTVLVVRATQLIVEIVLDIRGRL